MRDKNISKLFKIHFKTVVMCGAVAISAVILSAYSPMSVSLLQIGMYFLVLAALTNYLFDKSLEAKFNTVVLSKEVRVKNESEVCCETTEEPNVPEVMPYDD